MYFPHFESIHLVDHSALVAVFAVVDCSALVAASAVAVDYFVLVAAFAVAVGCSVPAVVSVVADIAIDLLDSFPLLPVIALQKSEHHHYSNPIVRDPL